MKPFTITRQNHKETMQLLFNYVDEKINAIKLDVEIAIPEYCNYGFKSIYIHKSGNKFYAVACHTNSSASVFSNHYKTFGTAKRCAKLLYKKAIKSEMQHKLMHD